MRCHLASVVASCALLAPAAVGQVNFVLSPDGEYVEDFESGTGGWTVMEESPPYASGEWELGAPAKAEISTAHGGAMCWMTDLDGDANPFVVESAVISPVLDLSALAVDPHITLYLAYGTSVPYASVSVELVDGASFSILDTFVGSSDGWQKVKVQMTGSAGRPAIQVRVTFRSNGSFAGAGAAFDDVRIRVEPCAAVATSYGAGLAGTNSTPKLTLEGEPWLGTEVLLQLSNSKFANSSGLLLVGTGAVEVPASGGWLLVSPDLVVPVPLSPLGLVVPLSIPESAPSCGVTMHLQGIVVDGGAPQGYAFSNRLTLDLAE